MDAASLFSNANVHYVNEDYEEALKHYTCAVTLEDCAEYRACRAAAYLKLGKFAETLEDADQALKFDPSCHMALHWKGIALFYMGEFAAAKLAFEGSIRISPGSKAPRALWVRKCDAELSNSSLPLGGVVAEASKAASAKAATNGFSTEASGASARPAEPSASVSSSSAAPASAAPASDAPDKSTAGLSISGRKPLRREWYQNTTHVIITIFAKGVAQENCKVEFQDKELSVSFPLPGSTDEEYQLDLDLFDSIEPSACKVEVSKVKVEIALAKKNVGFQWKDLERKVEEPEPLGADHPAYPTSSKQKRDWSQIDRDVEAELKSEKPAGEDALNKLFREIYERADEDTRRAMNKSFQTSGGTVLSTNWGEVAKNDYEGKDRPTPPDGQEWRDWRKK